MLEMCYPHYTDMKTGLESAQSHAASQGTTDPEAGPCFTLKHLCFYYSSSEKKIKIGKRKDQSKPGLGKPG
jgi:hypothetical protein